MIVLRQLTLSPPRHEDEDDLPGTEVNMAAGLQGHLEVVVNSVSWPNAVTYPRFFNSHLSSNVVWCRPVFYKLGSAEPKGYASGIQWFCGTASAQ